MALQGPCFRARAFGCAIAFAMLGVPTVAGAAQEPTKPPEQRQFGGDYAALSDVQKALVVDLFARFTRITGKAVDPEESYNGVRLSVRTTFEAVTHALSTSRLTDAASGEPLGTALDLIDHLEDVRGRVEGASGDRQFRLYVRLKPGTRETLERSKEFERKGNNTIFHKGYPLNYRQEGVPSMQVSISEDGTRADIDVDYRSESFPASLVNGHLTAANSDVRAGNYGRHTQRWEGLDNWWDGFFGSLFTGDTYEGESDAGAAFPLQPRAGDKTVDVAVADFLTSWLVEKKPNLAVAYLDRDAYDCLALRLEEEGSAIDPGLAKFQMYMRMKAVAEQVGPRASLAEATLGVRVFNPNFKLVRHDRHQQFVLQGVPPHIAQQMMCSSFTTLGALPQEKRVRYGDEGIEHFLSTFRLQGSAGRGLSLGMLWQKKEGHWKIVSYAGEQDAESEDDVLPTIADPVETAAVGRMPGDPALVAASAGFLEAWLKEKDYDRAMSYLSPRSYECVRLLGEPGDAMLQTPEEQRARLRSGIERTGTALGPIAGLEDAIGSVEPWAPQVRLIEHPRSAAWALFGLSDWDGQQADCRRMVEQGGARAAKGEDKSYGRYFVSAFQFRTRAGEPASLYLGWEKEEDAWRIFAFKIEKP